MSSKLYKFYVWFYTLSRLHKKHHGYELCDDDMKKWKVYYENDYTPEECVDLSTRLTTR